MKRSPLLCQQFLVELKIKIGSKIYLISDLFLFYFFINTVKNKKMYNMRLGKNRYFLMFQILTKNSKGILFSSFLSNLFLPYL